MNEPSLTNHNTSAAFADLLRLTASQAGRATDVLTQAFFEDVLWGYIFEDRTRRADLIRQVFGVNVRACMTYGEVYATSPNFEGVAVWMQPGTVTIPGRAMLRYTGFGFFRALLTMGSTARKRMLGLFEQFEKQREIDAPMPHWYLSILGVAPAYQGKGYGSRLLAPMLARCDAEGLHAYLETETPENVAFYQKRGFRVVTEKTMVGGGPRLWTMLRAPGAEDQRPRRA